MIQHKRILLSACAAMLWLGTVAVHADTISIGQELTNRATLDGGNGNLFGAEAFGFSEGTVSQWSIRSATTAYTGTRNITPVILEQTGAGGLGSVTVRGVGLTRALTHSPDISTFDFSLQSGSARMGPRHYFGWVDGDGAGGVNAGTISYGENNHQFTLWFGAGGVLSTGRTYAVRQNLNRRYSLQVDIDVDRSEAIGNGAGQRKQTESGLGGVFMQNDPFTQAGHVTEWAFWSWTDGSRSITPLILERVGGSFVLRGVGTSRAPVASQGTITYDLGLESGTNAVNAGHYFGWVDASVDSTSGDPANNAGVAKYAGDEYFRRKVYFLGNGHVAGTFLPGHDFGGGTLQDKAYSVQALSMIPADGALTVSSEYGVPNPSGMHGTFPGSVVTAAVDEVVTSGTTQYVSTGWIGTGSAPASGSTNTAIFTITNDSTIAWQWSTNYYLDMTVNPGGTTDVADGWFAAGSNMTVTAFPTNGGTAAWSGDIDGCTFPGPNKIVCPMDTPREITVDFPVAGNAFLTIISEHGGAVPVSGMTHQYPPGSVVETVVTHSPLTVGTTQYVCMGWSRVGSEPGAGTGTNASFTITSNTTQTWHWATNYYLDIAANPGGTTDVQSAFFPAGTNVTVEGYPNNGIAVSWAGDVEGCTIVSNGITCPMTRARAIAATFPVFTDGLMAYWNFDEGDSTIVLEPYGDVGDAGALGSGTASPPWIDGKVGVNALEFNGSNVVSAAYSADIGQLTGSSITSAITIQAWLRFDSNPPGSHDILDKRPANNTGGWTLEVDNDNLNWWINNTGAGGGWKQCQATGAIPGWVGPWMHVVLTWQSGAKMKMLVNDTTTFESAAPVGGTIFFRNDFLYFGAHIPGNDRFLDGAVDEVAIWNRVLSQGEITALYNSGAGRPVVDGLRGADISSVAVTQESDIRAVGRVLAAKSFGSISGVGVAAGGTVNGVTFTATPGTNHAEFSSAANGVFPSYDASTSLSGDLDSIFSGTLGLDDLGVSPDRRSTLTLSGLEIGRRYRLQWLSAAEGQTAGFWTFRNSDQGDVIATVGRHPNRNTRISFRATNTTQRIYVQEVPTAAPLINGYVLQQVRTIRPTVHAYSPGWNRLANLVNGATPNPADAMFATGFDRWPAADLKSDDAYNVHGGGPSAQGQAYALTNTNPWLVFDLGESANLASLLLWNGNQQVDRQARSFDVRVSVTDDFSAATVLPVTGLPNRPIGGVLPADAVDLLALGAELVNARYVRLSNFINYGDPEFLVLSEVRFETTESVPPPEGMFIIVR